MSKALVFAAYGGPETQELVERTAPAPGPGELAIEVKAAGVNPADWKIRAGQMGSHWPLPAPMGREASGVAQYGLVDPQVTDRYSLDRAAEAVAMVEAGHTAGKVIIEP